MNPELDLTPGEIHLWLAHYDGISDEALHVAYRELLNDAERLQEPKFHFARDRRRYLVTRAMVRTVLSRYAPVDPKAWVFSNNEYGRPEIANPHVIPSVSEGPGGSGGGTDLRFRAALPPTSLAHARNDDVCTSSGQPLSFNVSHTHDLIVLGVTRGRALGVDVENVRAREGSLDIAHHYFAPAEVAALNLVPREQQQDRFFEYWTFKESYIKARGMGLSLPLDKFAFHYAHDRAVELAIHPELADDPQRWQFWQFRPSPEYLVAICAERIGASSPRLTVRRTVPMVSDQPFAPELLRVSESVVNSR